MKYMHSFLYFPAFVLFNEFLRAITLSVTDLTHELRLNAGNLSVLSKEIPVVVYITRRYPILLLTN